MTGWRSIVAKVAGILLPKQDPDFFLQSGTVAYWWIELEDWEARREIGFSVDGEVLRFAPIGKNWGVFVGEEIAPRDLTDTISDEQFESAWARAMQAWPHVSSRTGAA